MAKVKATLPEEYIKRITKLGEKTDEISKTVLEAGGRAVLPRFKSNLSSVVGKDLKGKPRSTGVLLTSLGVTKPLVDNKGNYNIKLGFAEPRNGGESNAKIANILEYGKHGQPAKPFLKPTKSQTKKACEEAMKQKFEEEIKKL